jgi:Carboxypeptidase regulatory-like domain
MSGLLLSLLFLLQGIQVQQGGKVTGVLRDSLGMPLPGVRIAAVSRGDTVEAAAAGVSMSGLAETDEQGRFTLEDIPPGRYAIAAGRLDLQTYYPGTQSLADARVLTINAGESVTGINFVLNSASFGRSPTGLISLIQQQITATLPVRVVMENAAKLPVWANGRTVSIGLQSAAATPFSIPIDANFFTLPGPLRGDFRVVMENLPETFEVKSITYGSSDVTKSTFKLSDSNFPTIPNNPGTSPPAVPSSPTLSVFTVTLGTTLTGFGTVVVSSTPLKPAATPPSQITVRLGPSAQDTIGGVRVTGGIASTSKRPVYISGRPGVLYSDGTFEFRGVPPGRHLVASPSTSTPLAAVVVVGDKDLDGVELKETLVLPEDVRTPKDPAPAGPYPPGSVIPPARVRGIVLNEVTKEAIGEGDVEIKAGTTSRRVPIDSDGHFESFYLLPGTYNLSLQIFGHSSGGTMITIDDKDLAIELTSRRLY